MTQQQKLANEIYEWLLQNSHISNARINQLLWVINLTLIDTAIMVIQIWLQDNNHIESLADYIEYIEDMGE